MKFLKYLNLFMLLKKFNLLKKFKKIGNNFIFDFEGSTIIEPEYIEIGNNVFIGEKAHIAAQVTIGNNVMFGAKPMLLGGNHYFGIKGRSVRFLHPKNRENVEPIKIEDEVWCGAGVIILGNVTLGMGCVIGAGSVVTKSIPPYTIAVGNPCKPIKKIFDNDTLIEHLKLIGKTYNEAEYIKNIRTIELSNYKLSDIPTIDRTKEYWEFK